MALHQFKLLRGTHEELTNVEFTPSAPALPTKTYKTRTVYKAGDIIDTDNDLSLLHDQPGASQPRFQKIF